MLNLADLEGGESFDPAWLGQAEEVCQERVAEEELLLVRVRLAHSFLCTLRCRCLRDFHLQGCKTSRTASIILRGPSSFMLDEMER